MIPYQKLTREKIPRWTASQTCRTTAAVGVAAAIFVDNL
jgi:hypothetical protein